jgi:hypothetical protein
MIMEDKIFDETKKSYSKLKEQIRMLKKEIQWLRGLIPGNGEAKPEGPKTIENYTSLDFCKEFQKLFKEHVGKGYHISNFGSAGTAMKKIMTAFQNEGEDNKAVLEFIKWGVKQETYDHKYMTIGYLSTLIQDYRMKGIQLPKKEEPKVEKQDVDKQKMKELMARRLKK